MNAWSPCSLALTIETWTKQQFIEANQWPSYRWHYEWTMLMPASLIQRSHTCSMKFEILSLLVYETNRRKKHHYWGVLNEDDPLQFVDRYFLRCGQNDEPTEQLSPTVERSVLCIVESVLFVDQRCRSTFDTNDTSKRKEDLPSFVPQFPPLH